MLKDRNDSKWKRIIVIGSKGIPKKVFELDRYGKLIDKFPKQPYRKNKTAVKKIPSSQSCPILVKDVHQDDKVVVSKFIDAILRYNENDMSVMKLCYEQQKKQQQLAQDAQAQEKQKKEEKSDSFIEFDDDDILQNFFPSIIDDELFSSPENTNEINLFP